MSGQSSIWKPALALGGIGLVVAVVLAGLDGLTADRIEAQQQRQALVAISSMLAPDAYDNDLLADGLSVAIEGLDKPATAFRARLDGEPVAVILDLETRPAYSGTIRLLVAVDAAGSVLGARVLRHQETPGLGDKIERERSDWIDQFEGRSANDPPPDGWTADRQGGAFDTLTSATVTSAAVTEAIGMAVAGFERHSTEIFERPANSSLEEQ